MQLLPKPTILRQETQKRSRSHGGGLSQIFSQKETWPKKFLRRRKDIFSFVLFSVIGVSFLFGAGVSDAQAIFGLDFDLVKVVSWIIAHVMDVILYVFVTLTAVRS